MNRRVRRGALYLTAAAVMFGASVYICILPFITDTAPND